jgi:hypothetical protein
MPPDPDRRRRPGLIRRLDGAPARINVAAGIADTATPRPGDWTAQQIVLHLLAVEITVFQRRLRDLAELDRPEWTWVEPGPAEQGPNETIADTLVRFASARLATLEWVAGLDEAGWQRSGNHATIGPLDVTGLLKLAANHDADHLAALVQLGRPRRSRGSSLPLPG